MKRNIWIVSIIFVSIVALIFISDIMVIGDKLGSIPKAGVYCKFFFYGVLILLFLIFIMHPIIKLIRTPEFPHLSVDGSDEMDDLRRLSKQMASSFNYIDDRNLRIQRRNEFLNANSTDLIKCGVNYIHTPQDLKRRLEMEIKVRLDGDASIGVKGINNLIKEWAKTIFMVTAASPSSKVDAFSALVLNFTMMKCLINSTGYRPTNAQLWRLYFRILVTALLSYSVSEALKGVGSIRPLGFLENNMASDAASDADDILDSEDMAPDSEGDSFSLTNTLSKLKIPGAIVGPVLDGISNALLTLRIGYVTRSYLIEGQELYYNKEKCLNCKKEALKESIKSMPSVLEDGCKGMGNGVKRIVSWYVNGIRKSNNSNQ